MKTIITISIESNEPLIINNFEDLSRITEGGDYHCLMCQSNIPDNKEVVSKECLCCGTISLVAENEDICPRCCHIGFDV